MLKRGKHFVNCPEKLNTPKDKRKDFGTRLKRLGHDLLKIIHEIHKIQPYNEDDTSAQFLKRVEGIVRGHYFPLYEPDSRSSEWSQSRYPKRFLRDEVSQAKSDSFKSWPSQWMIVRLFEPMENHVDRLWGTRKMLVKERP